MALKILLVDSDESWLGNTKKFLSGLSYEVQTVYNGREAQLAIYNNKYFAILINYEIKNHSCLQVLKFIKSSTAGYRIFLVFNNQSLLNSGEMNKDKLIKLGITGPIVKPMDYGELKALLEDHQCLADLMNSLPQNGENSFDQEVPMPDAYFSKIKMNDFFSSKIVLYDLFFKLDENKYLKIFQKGDLFSKEKIVNYQKEKGGDFLYFQSTDRRKYILYNNFLAKKLMINKKISPYSKLNILRHVIEKYFEEILTSGIKNQTIDIGREIGETIFLLIDGHDDLFKYLKDYEYLEPNIYSSSFLVTIYTCSIIKKFDWHSKSMIETAALGCLLHDIGKLHLPKDIAFMRPFEMNQDQYIQYKKHPEFGMQIVESFRSVNNSIKQIILQHHEAYDGTGFPYGKKGSKILNLANIVCLMDDFVHTMLDQKLSPEGALKKIIGSKETLSRYNPVFVETFEKFFSGAIKSSMKSKNSKAS